MAGNLLENPGFEGGSSARGAPQVVVADHWEPWWDSGDTRPEFKIATRDIDPNRVRPGGDQAQQWFNSFATHTAGVYQRITGLTPGREIRFSAYVQAFSSNTDDFSHSNGRYRMRIGRRQNPHRPLSHRYHTTPLRRSCGCLPKGMRRWQRTSGKRRTLSKEAPRAA